MDKQTNKPSVLRDTMFHLQQGERERKRRTDRWIEGKTGRRIKINIQTRGEIVRRMERDINRQTE